MSPPKTEYDAARSTAAFFDLSQRAKLELTGADRATFLHGFCTNDIMQLAPGHGCEAFVTNMQARILAWIRVYAAENKLELDADPGLAEKLLKHLKRYAISEDIEFHDRTGERALLHLAGPNAESTLQGLTTVRLPSDLHAHAETTIADLTCRLRRLDRLALPGFDIVCDIASAAAIANTLESAGRLKGSNAVFDILRVEAGEPEYGRDIDESNLPQEVNRMDKAVCWTKGCYLGQEPICRIRDLGHVNRLLLGLKLAAGAPALPESRVLRDGQEVGKITSSVVSPRLRCAIALAYIRRGHQQPGTRMQVETANGPVEAELSVPPFA